ncbi:MAG: class I SAM-dependent methyltransferase [Lachnospiraceae bacterium]|nr:class I SAM-dependent methyltransferase [Lachnospiraceae bacterium]
MGGFSRYIGSQFGNPRGFIGKCCCVIMNIINKAMYRKVVSLIRAESDTNILDIGYGNGYLTQQIYKEYKSNIYGIDISEDMKHLANKRNHRGVFDGKIHLEVGDCCNLSYDNGFFDNAVSINTIYFWNDTLKGLEEINRTLKANGSFYNVVYTKEWLQKLSYTKVGFKFFEKEEFIRLGEEAGFTNVEIRNISKDKSFVVIYKK